MSASAHPFAVIFDWDGVIVDSEDSHREAWRRLAAALGRELPDDCFEKSFGRRNVDILRELLRWTADPVEIAGLVERKETLYREVVRERGVPLLPGVRALLERLAAAGVPCAIGSSTARANIELSLELTGCSRFFKAMVASEDVEEGKPHPEVFLKAAQRLGVAPSNCVVIEDALAGLEAARRAGMTRMAVATSLPVEVLAGHAERVLGTLDELVLEAVLGAAV